MPHSSLNSYIKGIFDVNFRIQRSTGLSNPKAPKGRCSQLHQNHLRDASMAGLRCASPLKFRGLYALHEDIIAGFWECLNRTQDQAACLV